ncbi:MAG: helix-turn-helix transcriptional regulator [Eubacteriales bacterium]|nr:helix-turn-helix transcriptional regulator [Eubacteriales bacterium]
MNKNYSIGNKIRAFRRAKGFSQEELAFRAEISSVYLRQIEKEDKNPTINTILKLCDALCIHPSDLFENNEPVPLSDTEQQIMTFLADKTEEEKNIILELIKTAFKLQAKKIP